MRFSCKSCQATFQTATGAPATAGFRCPSCNGEMAVVAEVVDLYQDRIPTRRYDLDDLRARLDLEREEFAKSRGAPRSADQVWFAAVQGRQVGPLSVAGIAGLRARGQLSAASLVWREGWPSWVAAEAVPELRQILGLPEETLGQPFPVQPAEPAPPPFESTYAAARSQPPGEPLVESSFASSAAPNKQAAPSAALTLDITDAPDAPVAAAAPTSPQAPARAEPPIGYPEPGDRTDPDARVPEALLRSFAALDRATAAAAAQRAPSPSLPFDAPNEAPSQASVPSSSQPAEASSQASAPSTNQLTEALAQASAPSASQPTEAAPLSPQPAPPIAASAAPAAPLQPLLPEPIAASAPAPSPLQSVPAAAAFATPIFSPPPPLSASASPPSPASQPSSALQPSSASSPPQLAPPIPFAPLVSEPPAPPALPLADESALEQAATAVLAQARLERDEPFVSEPPPLSASDRTTPGSPAPIHLLAQPPGSSRAQVVPVDAAQPTVPSRTQLHDPDRTLRTAPDLSLFRASESSEPVAPASAQQAPPAIEAPSTPAALALIESAPTTSASMESKPGETDSTESDPTESAQKVAAPVNPAPIESEAAADALAARPVADDFPPQSSLAEPDAAEEITAPGNNPPSRPPPPTRGYRGKAAAGKGRGHGGRATRSSPPPGRGQKDAAEPDRSSAAGTSSNDRTSARDAALPSAPPAGPGPASAAISAKRPVSNPAARSAAIRSSDKGRATRSAAITGDFPRVSDPALPMVDLSAPAPTDELPRPRRSRTPSQQSWFGSEEAPPATDSRSKVLFLVALALIVAVLAIWFHRGPTPIN